MWNINTGVTLSAKIKASFVAFQLGRPKIYSLLFLAFFPALIIICLLPPGPRTAPNAIQPINGYECKHPLGEQPIHLWPTLPTTFSHIFCCPELESLKVLCLLCCGTNRPASPVFYPCRSQSRTPVAGEDTKKTLVRFQEKRQEKVEGCAKIFVGYNWLNKDNLQKALPWFCASSVILGHRRHRSHSKSLNSSELLCHNNSANSPGFLFCMTVDSALVVGLHIYFDTGVLPKNRPQYQPNCEKVQS